MRKIVLILLALFFNANVHAQSPELDSLKMLLSKERNPIKQFDLFKTLSGKNFETGRLNEAKSYIERMFQMATQQKNDSLFYWSYSIMTTYLDFKTESKQEIEYALKALRIAEAKYPSLLPSAFIQLAAPYADLENYSEALKYLRKAQQLLPLNDPTNSSNGSLYFQFSLCFRATGQYDSALYYIQRRTEWDLKNASPGRRLFTSVQTAMLYEQIGNKLLAESYYRNSLDRTGSKQSYGNAHANSGYSLFLLKNNRITEAKFYGLRGLAAAKASQAKKPLLRSVEALQKIYFALHQPDSAYYYATLQLAYRDSLFNQEKMNAVQDISFNESIRQKEEEAKHLEETEQRKHNLQYAGISLGLISFLILFFLFSHSIIANQRFIRFLGVVALLIVFEFINLYIHPYLSHATNDSPLLMLLVMVCIASLLVPVHHRMEHWITHKLVEKNNRIRLAAAKKTIAKLESEQTS